MIRAIILKNRYASSISFINFGLYKLSLSLGDCLVMFKVRESSQIELISQFRGLLNELQLKKSLYTFSGLKLI